MNARITIFRSDAAVQQVYLQPAHSYKIGRTPECDVCIDDPELSRLHASLSYSDDKWHIQDHQSKNGVAVSGRAVKKNTDLDHGTWITLGSLIMRFEILTEFQQQQVTARQDQIRQMTLDGRQQIAAAVGVEDVLRKLMESVLNISSTQRGFAMLTQPDGDLEVACSHGVACEALGATEFQGSRGAIIESLDKREVVVTCDAALHSALANRHSIISAQTRALVCLPLTVLGRVVGVIYADSQEPGKFFTELDIQLLKEMADHAALVIAAAQIGDDLDSIDRQFLPGAATVQRLSPLRNRIPDVRQQVPGLRPVPMTGVRWSSIGARL